MSVNFNELIEQRPVTQNVSRTAASLMDGQKNLSENYTTFLNLLTTQLKNQDPVSPLDTNAFTQQLVQMTGVQQQLLSNELLQQLVNQKDNSGYEAVGLIGKNATVVGAEAQLAEEKASWSYELSSAAAKATLTVTDAKGSTVWSGDAPSLAKGKHAFEWNGKDANGQKLPDGVYTLKVSAADTAAAAVSSIVYVTAKVTAIERSNNATLLTVGGSKVPLSAVTAVSA